MAEQASSLKVFVSYSRADVAFADQLVLALEDKGFSAILDRHDISGAENWRERLGKLILSADAVAFVLTAKSAASDICAWEVDEARRLGKRIIPVTPEPLGALTPPQALSELNWIPFYAEPAIPGSGFYYGVKRLNEALSVDLDWLRAQTRYSERALEWAHDKAEDLLLRGEALKEAEGWLARKPAGANPPDRVREYLAASGDAEQRRQAAAQAQLAEREQALKAAEAAVVASREAQRKLRRFSLWALVAGVLLLAIAIPGNYFATVRTLEANDRRAALFAEAANALTRSGDASRGMLMAIAGDPAAKTGLIEDWLRPNGNPGARAALVRAFTSDKLVRQIETGSPIYDMAAIDGGKRLVTFHEDRKTRVWNLEEPGEPVIHESHAPMREVLGVIPAGDGKPERLVIQPGDFSMAPLMVDPLAWGEGETRSFQANVRASTMMSALSSAHDAIAVLYDNGQVALWSLEDGATPAIFQLIEIEDGRRPTMMLAGPRGDTIALGYTDGSVSVITVRRDASGRAVGGTTKSLAIDQSGVMSMTAFENLEGLVVGFESGRGAIVGTDLGTPIFFPGFQAAEMGDLPIGIARVALSADAELLTLVSTEGQVKLVRGDSGLQMDPLPGRRDAILAQLIGDSDRLVTATPAGTVRVWALARADLTRTIAELDDSAMVATNADAILTIVRGHAVVRGLEDAMPAIPATDGDVSLALISPDGQMVAERSAYSLCLRPAAGGTCRELTKLDDGSVLTGYAFDPQGQTFGVMDADGEVRVWGLQGGEPATAEMDTAGLLSSIVMSPGGAHVAVLADGGVRLLRMSDGTQEMLPKTLNASMVAFSPDGQRMAVGFASGGVQVWKIGAQEAEHAFEGHTRMVQSMTFDTTGELLLTGGSDGAALLWKMGEREPLERYEAVESDINGVTIAADRRYVVLKSLSRISRWPINPIVLADAGEQIGMACQRLDELQMRTFTPEDRRRYFSIMKDVDDDPCVAAGYKVR